MRRLRTMLATMWGRFWEEINTPSDFRADPYGELTNQCAHTFLGLILAIVCSLVGLVWFGEYPQKEGIGIAVTLPYILGEVFAQRWRGWDTVADVFFYAIGGYGVLTSLTEVQVDGVPYLEANVFGFVVCLLGFCLVMFFRLRTRVKEKYGTV